MITVERTGFISVPVTDIGRSKQFYDPDGNQIMLHRRYAP